VSGLPLPAFARISFAGMTALFSIATQPLSGKGILGNFLQNKVFLLKKYRIHPIPFPNLFY
jgi:hypothetical protein